MKKILRKSQALVEMAIFGTIILTILGTLLSYIYKMNEQQYVAQESFRKALNKAYTLNGSASYTIMSNRRTASVASPLHGDRGQISGSASIYWGVGGSDNETWYQFNEDAVTIDIDDDNGVEDIDTSSASKVTDTTRMTYSPGVVITSKSSQLNDTITYTLKNESGSTLYSITQGLGPGGKYSTAYVGRDVSKKRVWRTAND